MLGYENEDSRISVLPILKSNDPFWTREKPGPIQITAVDHEKVVVKEQTKTIITKEIEIKEEITTTETSETDGIYTIGTQSKEEFDVPDQDYSLVNNVWIYITNSTFHQRFLKN